MGRCHAVRTHLLALRARITMPRSLTALPTGASQGLRPGSSWAALRAYPQPQNGRMLPVESAPAGGGRRGAASARPAGLGSRSLGRRGSRSPVAICVRDHQLAWVASTQCSLPKRGTLVTPVFNLPFFPKCDASWPSDACKIERFRTDLGDPPQCSRRKSGVGDPSGYLAEWTHTSAEPSTVQPFAHVTRPKWANVAGGISSCGRRSQWCGLGKTRWVGKSVTRRPGITLPCSHLREGPPTRVGGLESTDRELAGGSTTPVVRRGSGEYGKPASMP